MQKWILSAIIVLLAITIVYYFLPEQKLPEGKIEKLVVSKNERIMFAYSNGRVVKTYQISLGRNPTGDKQCEGDERTPEGRYEINDKNPNSGYHKNLGISYPNKNDIREAAEKKLKPGGSIKIHGLRNGMGFIGKFHRMFDWTAGCIALTDEEVDELYHRVDVGTPIIILP